MKLAHRIITPIFAVGAIALGFFLKMFYFQISGSSDTVSGVLALIQQLAPAFGGNFSLEYEYSVFELIKMLLGAGDTSSLNAASFMTVFAPIKTHLIVFIAFLLLAIVVLLAITVLSALGKRKATLITSCVGLVFLFVSIVSSRLAFDIITSPEGGVSLGALVQSFVGNEIISQILAVEAVQSAIDGLISVQTAILSAGFFAILGMFLLIIFWTIFANMIIKNPIHIKRKHRRKPVLKRPSAFFQK